MKVNFKMATNGVMENLNNKMVIFILVIGGEIKCQEQDNILLGKDFIKDNF